MGLEEQEIGSIVCSQCNNRNGRNFLSDIIRLDYCDLCHSRISPSKYLRTKRRIVGAIVAQLLVSVIIFLNVPESRQNIIGIEIGVVIGIGIYVKQRDIDKRIQDISLNQHMREVTRKFVGGTNVNLLVSKFMAKHDEVLTWIDKHSKDDSAFDKMALASICKSYREDIEDEILPSLRRSSTALIDLLIDVPIVDDIVTHVEICILFLKELADESKVVIPLDMESIKLHLEDTADSIDNYRKVLLEEIPSPEDRELENAKLFISQFWNNIRKEVN
jgi:hypothetical protein